MNAAAPLRRLALPLIKRVHPDALSHLAAPSSALETNATSLKVLNGLLDGCQEAVSPLKGRGKRAQSSVAPSYRLTFFLQSASVVKRQEGEGGVESAAVELKKCEAELRFPRHLMTTGSPHAIQQHAETQLRSLMAACGLDADGEAAKQDAHEMSIRERVKSGAFAKTAAERRKDRISKQEFDRLFAESVQKATNGWAQNSGSRAGSLPFGSSSATCHRAAENYLRAGHLLFHGHVPLPLQAMCFNRLSLWIGDEFEGLIANKEELWAKTVLVATDEADYGIKRNTAGAEGSWVLVIPANFEEEDLGPFMRQAVAVMKRGSASL